MTVGRCQVVIVRAAFWAARLDRHRPGGGSWPGYQVGEVSCADADLLARAMGARPEVVVRRFLGGARAWAAWSPRGGVASWLWVSVGHEHAEPIRRELTLAPDEAYGWDAGTLAPHRGRGLFTCLLEAAGDAALCEGRKVMWGGIHDHNLASRRANVRAGFRPVLRLSALLLGGRCLIRTSSVAYADPELVARARRLLASGEARP